MKAPRNFIVLFLCMTSMLSIAQVSIGTTTPDDGSAFEIESTTGAFVPPRMTTAQMNAIPTPLEGSIIYNTDSGSNFIFKNSRWNIVDNASIILNRDYGSANSAISTTNNTYFDFPIGSADVVTTNSLLYSVTANGTIQVLQTGNYLLSASFSTSNLPTGSHKFIIGVERNGTLIGYLSRGFVNIPTSGADYWGTSGTLMYRLNINDVLTFRYVLNNSGTSLDARFFNIGVSKLN